MTPVQESIQTALFLLLAGCTGAPEPPGPIIFENVTEKAGLIEPLKGMAGHNGVWGDVNGDGYPDLVVGTFTHFYDSAYDVRGHTRRT